MRRVDVGWLLPSRARALFARPPVARARQLVLRLARRGVREFNDDHCAQLAAAISYHVLFSIFPLAIAGIGVLGLVTGSPRSRDSVLSELLKVLPLDAHGRHQLRTTLDSISGGAGALGLLGVLGVLWSASGVMAAIRTAINIAWDVGRRRPFVRGKLVDLALLLGTFVVVAATLGLVLLTSLARDGANDLPSGLAALAGPSAVVFTALVTLALLAATFAGLFRFLPAARVRARDALLGGAVAALGIGALQLGFSIYLSNFAHYNRVYGSLGAIVAFLFFVYLASMVFLFGAEIASELPRLSSPDEPDSSDASGDANDESDGRL